MSKANQISGMMARYRLSENSPILAVDETSHFYCEKDKKSAYLGACFLTDPIDGISQSHFIALVSTLSLPLPPQSIIQFSYISTNHIDERVERYADSKATSIENNPNITDAVKTTLSDTVEARKIGLLNAKVEAPIARSQVTVRDNRVLLSVKIPMDLKNDEEEYQTAVDFINKLSDGLRNNIFPNLRQLTVREYLAQARSILYPNDPLSFEYDVYEEVGKQMFAPTTVIDNRNNNALKINDTNIRMLSVKALPEINTIALMNEVIGASDGLYNQIITPFLINVTLITQDVTKKNQNIETMFMQADDQCTPFAQKFSPPLKKRRDGLERIFKATKESEIPVEMILNIFMMHEDMSKLNRCITSMQNHYKAFGLNMQPDTDIILPLFWNALPLNPSPESLKGAERHRTLTMKSAGTFLPLFSDYTGHYSNFSQIYYTRRSAIYGFDATSGLNSNGMIFGSSGSGKSFFTQNFVTQEFESKAMIRIIDEGRSYMKLCEIMDGQFIEFGKDSDVCLNPFTHIQDIDEDLEQLTTMFLLMAAPSGEISDYDRSLMSETIKACYATSKNKTNVDNIVVFLRNQDDESAKRMATQLFKYGSTGPHGKWFNGVNNLDLSNPFIVLELDELKTQKELKTVVMMMILSRIQYDMMKNTNYPRKFVFFEEVSSYLRDELVAVFIADFYARLRKYNAGTWLITQSMSSIKNTPAIEDMINNSYTRIYLKHSNAAEITQLAENGYIPNDDYIINKIRSLNTIQGEFSEAFILRESQGQVVRVALPRFFQILYSSKGNERDLIQNCQKAGVPVTDAIKEYIRLESRNVSDDYMVAFFGSWAETSKLAKDWMIPYDAYYSEFQKVSLDGEFNRLEVMEYFKAWVRVHGDISYLEGKKGFGLEAFDMGDNQ